MRSCWVEVRVDSGSGEARPVLSLLKGRKELLPVSRSFVHVFRQM